jgi:hypothetical protein
LIEVDMLRRLFIKLFVLLLLGYVFLGKGFAYFHIPTDPAIYIGEIVLAAGIIALARPRTILPLTRNWTARIFLALALLGLARTFINLSEYGTDAIRDFALLYYGGFMFLSAALIKSRETIQRTAKVYSRIAPFYLVWTIIPAILKFSSYDGLPTVPGTAIPIILLRPSDVAIHVGAILVFVLTMPATLAIARHALTTSVLCMVGLAPTLYSRASFLAATVGVSCAALLRSSRRIVRVGLATMTLLLILLALDPAVKLPDRNRVLSVQGITQGVMAMLNPAPGYSEAHDTISWRCEWWKAIADDVFFGPLFWTGHGFGENLALTYGIITNAGGEYLLRSPHNVNVTFLGRLGVPGLALWVAMNIAWLVMIWKVFRRARRQGDDLLSGVSVWLIAYWLMAILIASTDVYLEGPQGGIWFWTVMGMGIAVARIQKTESFQTHGGLENAA